MMAFKPVSNKLVIESAIDNYNKQIEEAAIEKQKEKNKENAYLKESEEIVRLRNRANSTFNRFTSFSESVSHALLSECIYYVYSKAMRKPLMEQKEIPTMMRAMISDFVHEDYSDIIFKMRTKNATLSEMYNLIQKTKKSIFESEAFDRNDPSTYRIDSEKKDEFFDTLDKMDTESISNAIRERVSKALEDFVTSNKEDHDKIMAALNMTKDKLEEVSDQPEEVKESYQQLSKRFIGKIRNRKKSVFESMVMAMCESVMKDAQLKEEFTEGAKLNMGKIVDRIETMYTFIETVNTMGLYPVDEEYMQNLVNSLRA